MRWPLGSGEEIGSEVSAGLGLFVVLIGEDGADEVKPARPVEKAVSARMSAGAASRCATTVASSRRGSGRTGRPRRRRSGWSWTLCSALTPPQELFRAKVIGFPA
jgi:hypothetical protein